MEDVYIVIKGVEYPVVIAQDDLLLTASEEITITEEMLNEMEDSVH